MALLFLASLFSMASEVPSNPLWMRYPRISPDGKQIAFAYKGDIYVVDSEGGQARQITSSESFESGPIWSNDSRTIAFWSDRFGSGEIFTVPVTGGPARRVTTHSYKEIPLAFSPDDKYIYFSSNIQDPASSVLWWGAWCTELYKIPVEGGRPVQVVAAPVCSIDFDKDGESFLYYNRTGNENIWRKHHTSSVARDIFYYNAKDGSHTKVTENKGEDRDPIFTSDGKMIYLSERDGGSFNVYESSVSGDKSPVRLTDFKDHPVRFLSRSDNGIICFSYHGEIYTIRDGRTEKVKINLVNDSYNRIKRISPRYAYVGSVSADGKQLAVISRGEVFATTDKYSTTRQITNTPAAESDVTISPDGKTLIYDSERTGVWNLYKTTRQREEDVNFANATLLHEEPLFKDNKVDRANPKFSPDGKEVAFIQGRKYLMVLNLETGKVRQITDGKQHYSNNYYGFDYEWSPDGKWFALTFLTNRREPYSDIGIVSATEGGRIHNVTNSGYIDRKPKWVMDGNAIMFISNRLGMRSHASWGSQDDAFIAFMNQETADRFNMTEEEYYLYEESEKLKKETEKKDDDKKDDDKKDKADKKEIVIDFDGLENRIQRLTPMSSRLSDAILTDDGQKLYFLSAFEKGYDLWKRDIRKGDMSIVKKGVGNGSMMLDKEGKKIIVLSSSPKIVTISNNEVKNISFNLSMDLDQAGEREYMFDHVFKQQEHLFYREDYHGVDLKKLKKAYQPFLAHIDNNYDFSEMLSEILGELNVSHTGSGYYAPSAQKPTAELGLLFDMNYTGDGLKVDEVLVGGPFAVSMSKVEAGTIIESIDGVEITSGTDYFPLLNGKVSKNVHFGLKNPVTGERWEEVVKPVSRSAQNEMLYEKWVKSRAEEVERLSGGRLGYVHIRSMNDESYRDVYADILGKYNLKEGIVIDTRFNGGGRLHEDIEILFSGEKYLEQVIRGTVSCEMPSRRYNKPSIMLVGEANYSNAHGTPWVYRYKKIGSIVGMPVPGTMTSVTWETLQDDSMYFGIPKVGYRTAEGTYLENSQLEPDFLVRNKVEEAIEGRDEQLEVAVRELLRQISH